MHATKNDIGTFGVLRRQFRQHEGITPEICMLNDFVALVVVSQDQNVIAERALRCRRAGKELLSRPMLIVDQR